MDVELVGDINDTCDAAYELADAFFLERRPDFAGDGHHAIDDFHANVAILQKAVELQLIDEAGLESGVERVDEGLVGHNRTLILQLDPGRGRGGGTADIGDRRSEDRRNRPPYYATHRDLPFLHDAELYASPTPDRNRQAVSETTGDGRSPDNDG